MNEVMIRRVLGAVVLLVSAFLVASLVPGPETGQDGSGLPSAETPDHVVRYDLQGGRPAGLKLEPALKAVVPEPAISRPEQDSGSVPEEEQAVDGTIAVASAATKPAAPAPETVQKTPTPSLVASAQAEAGWFVQIGSFADPANARSVRERLLGAKLPASVQEVKVGRATWYRVRVGPYSKEAAAQKSLERVRALDYRGARLFQDSGP